jgi:hypothetical protein
MLRCGRVVLRRGERREKRGDVNKKGLPVVSNLKCAEFQRIKLLTDDPKGSEN